MIADEKQLLHEMRGLLDHQGSDLHMRDGHWKVSDRIQAWERTGKLIFDEHLDRLEKIAIDVLRESDPKFKLEPEERILCQGHMEYSADLRKGIAETVALLGARPELISHASNGKAETTALLIVRGVFVDCDWSVLASLDRLLPLLAEAAPEEFMSQIEAILRKSQGLFTEMFVQERDAFTGGTVTAGLLWALENLAWSPDYLTRVIKILGNLSDIDPGGTWSNRPVNSIIDILVPWLPHTCAGMELRITAVKGLLRSSPATCWKVLLALLPNGHRTTSDTHKPLYRDFTTAWEKGVKASETRSQYVAYAQMAIAVAKSDPEKLYDLVKQFDNLPVEAWDQLEQHLIEVELKSDDSGQKQKIWENITRTALKHRRFRDADWAMQEEYVDRLDALADKFKPASVFQESQPLFNDSWGDFFEGDGSYEERSSRMFEKKSQAILAIYAEGGIDRILEFSRVISNQNELGHVVGKLDLDMSDSQTIPLCWQSQEDQMITFVRGFVWGRFHAYKWSWFDELDTDGWDKKDLGKTMAIFPFSKETWDRVSKQLGIEESYYWHNTYGHAMEAGDDLNYGIEKYILNDCPASAIRCLSFQERKLEGLQVKLAVTALQNMQKTKNPTQHLDAYDTIQVIEALQESSEVDTDELALIEWSYLGLLTEHNHGSPVNLHKKLAYDSSFFCEMINILYRPMSEYEEKAKPTENQKRLAENAWHLLHEWKLPPGSNDDGSIDKQHLTTWIEYVEKSCKENERFEVAQLQVGQVFRYAPEDPSGLWIHRAIADVLERDSRDKMRDGYRSEWFNSRGVFSYTHGEEERKLAESFRDKVKAIEAEGYVNLATTMRDLAKSYEADGNRDEKNDPFDRW